ncbi:Uncharacterised protein [Rodentibacter pneumotropicus]|uniref:Uncharacterized protein n=1 Tax=Rodentibacter pneumotropicus TaxID=758 RepID=A0A3S4W0P7_9PAST|nr:Uncharacterised protein [Rodentibacter pneumotropicus]
MLIYVLYLPVGLSFGYPQYQHIISFFATDASEVGEFLSLIPLKNYAYAFLSCFLLFLFEIF